MGICVHKNIQNLETVYGGQPEFQVDRSKRNMKCLAVWKVTQNQCKPLKWIYKFLSTCCYIVMVAANTVVKDQTLNQDRVSIQLAEMLFGAQFLVLHLKSSKKLLLNNKQYEITVYSFYGDSVDDELIAKAQLNFHYHELMKYMQLGAGTLCLRLMNQAEPITLKGELKQYIDFESNQYEQARNHIFFREQIFCSSSFNLQKALKQANNSAFFQRFINSDRKIPFIEIKQLESNKLKGTHRLQNEQSLPFACEITQINIRDKKKGVNQNAGNIQSSHILFEELNMEPEIQQIQKIQEFLKGLYLASQKVAKNFNILNQSHIKLVINCSASTCRNWFINDMSYKWIDMPDPLQQPEQFNIECLIYQVADLAGKTLKEPAGIIIHCSGYDPKVQFSGSRSGAIMAGLIMSFLNVNFEGSLGIINKKWKMQLPKFMEQQLKQLETRRKQKPRGFYVYIICSYTQSFPKHLVAKYICEVENTNNIQGIDDFAKNVFLCVSHNSAKIMVGRQCPFKEDYEKYAKEHLRLLNKYEGFAREATVELIDKTFRKQPRIEIKQQIVHVGIKAVSKNAGFKRNEEIVFKYPILRPIWEKKKQDGFYFTIKQKADGAEIIMNKGSQWIGYEEDKQQFFQKLISSYLNHLAHQKIYVAYSQEEKSLFDTSLSNI